MANFANQKTIEISNQHIDKIAHPPTGKDAFLRAIEWKYIEQAQQVLSGNEFTVLVYILKWAGKGEFDFSPAAVEIATQMSASTASRARQTLENLGFIKLKEEKSNRYEIDLNPPGLAELAVQKRAENIVNRQNKKKVVPKMNETFLTEFDPK